MSSKTKNNPAPKQTVLSDRLKNRGEREKRIQLDFVFGAMMIAALFFALWKTHYGYRDYDETFFLSMAHRLSQGDVMFKHEWNLSQMAGFLLIPFVKLYTWITGGTEGIILAARTVYTLLHAGVAVIIYLRFRERRSYVIALACVMFFLFSPFSIMAYSYNSMALDLITLSGVVLATANYEKKLPLILSGLMFAGAVLCSPYMLFVYMFYVFCVAVHHILKKIGILKGFVIGSEMFSVKTLLWCTVGAASLAVVFLVWLLPRVSIGEILESVNRMMGYSRLQGYTFGMRVSSYFRSIYTLVDGFMIGLIVFGVNTLVMVIDRNRSKRAGIYLSVSALCTLYTLFLIIPKSTEVYFNGIMLPMLYVSISSYILCKNKPRELFASLFVVGILYSFVAFLGSDQGIHIICVAFTAANMAGYVFLSQVLKEMFEDREIKLPFKAVRIAALVMVIATLGTQLWVQVHVKRVYSFWEFGIDTLDVEFKDGPAKGLYSADYTVNKYETIYNDIQYYKSKEPDNLLVIYPNPWIYLELNDMRYAGYSAWIGDDRYTSAAEVSQRLLDYWEENPEKMPKYVYIVKGTGWDINTLFGPFVGKGYTYFENDVSYKMERTDAN